MQKPITSLTGRRYGRWTVGRMTRKRKLLHYWCRCDCGTRRLVKAGSLQCGVSNSCGCLKADRASELMSKHRMINTPEYRSWSTMRSRCLRPPHPSWKNYGGRGITICDQWDDFRVFFRDMGKRPQGHKLERINNDGPYSPDNCRWATPAEQNINRRNTVKLTYRGITKPLKTWADDFGMPYDTLVARIRYRWSVEDALTKPKHFRHPSGHGP